MRLPDEFPVRGGGVSVQGDAPITRLHVHDCLELGTCLSGAGIFVVEDKVMPFRSGDVSVINGRELHLAQSARGSVSEWSWIMLDPLRLLGASVDDPQLLDPSSLCGRTFRNILSGSAHADIATLARELATELRERNAGWRSAVRGLVLALMTRLSRLPNRNTETESATRRDEMGRIAPALQAVATHYMDPIDLTDLARRCGLSPTHFRRVFRKATGKAPLDYVNHVRLKMAAALLASTTRTILDIALDVGYPTLSTFYRNFRSATGLSPRAWRKAAEAQVNPEQGARRESLALSESKSSNVRIFER